MNVLLPLNAELKHTTVGGMMFNLLTEPLISILPREVVSLPGLLARLSRGNVESFPALRPHQVPAWHMFLVQLAALALLEQGQPELPQTEEAWRTALRALTKDFSKDEPWCLVVGDWEKPAFLQPPVPQDVKLANPLPSADALDLLITSKNHDLKQAVARQGQAEDWLFALVSLQTGEGYGGQGNHGIARMNGGSSSRPFISLAPLPNILNKDVEPSPDARFRRDVNILLTTREQELNKNAGFGYPVSGGLGLTWLAPWPDGEQLELKALDLWFIEVCRRIRLDIKNNQIHGWRGTSKSTRINAKPYKGAVGDPFAPVHITEGKSFTLSEKDFDYKTLSDLLFPKTAREWELPLLARLAPAEQNQQTMAVTVAALARGNSKTAGFKSRTLPIKGTAAKGLGPQREKLHQLAQAQIEEISKVDDALTYALALFVAGAKRAVAEGEREKLKKDHYRFAHGARQLLNTYADEIFFDHLWERFEASQKDSQTLQEEQDLFCHALKEKACSIFEATLPAMPCLSTFRPRAEDRARRAFRGALKKHFPQLTRPDHQNEQHIS